MSMPGFRLRNIPVRSFQFRLLLYLLFIGSIPLVCALLVFYRQSDGYAHQELKSHIRQAHVQMLDRIRSELDGLVGIADDVAHDYIIQEYLADNTDMTEQRFENRVIAIRDRLERQTQYLSNVCLAIDDVRVCTNDAIFPHDNPSNPASGQAPYFRALKLSVNEPRQEAEKFLVTYVSPLTDMDSNVIKGQIVVVLDAGRLLSDMHRQFPSIAEYGIYEGRQLIYHDGGGKLPALIPDGGAYPVVSGNHIIDQLPVPVDGLNWVSRLDAQNDFLAATWRSMRNTLLIFFGILFLLSVLSSLVFSKYIIGPIHHLRSLMKRAELGDLKAYWTNRSMLEIDHLGESYNQMLNRLEELFKQVKHEESLKKEAEIEALQYQLNPHFLYNTLNTIKWVAKIHKTPQISGVVSALVRLLQASLGKKGDFITINEEIGLIRDYMEIQAFRYGDQVEMRYEIDPVAAVCLVPKMLFQPLVENALIHGLEPSKEDGVITIKAWIDRDLLMCEVSDNGRGIAEISSHSQESGIMPGEVKERMSGIGLTHIRQKIKLYYGPEYKMHIFNGSEKGTVIRLSLPIHRGDDEI